MQLVDADVLRDTFTEILDDSIGAECDGVLKCLRALDSAPTMEQEKVCIGKVAFDKDARPHGYWVSGTGAASSWLFCSECSCVRKKEIAPMSCDDIFYPAFCEECGAEMHQPNKSNN